MSGSKLQRQSSAVLFDYLIAAAIGFAGMLGMLHLGAEIITLNEQTFQITMAEAILRELSVLAHLADTTPSDAKETCAGPIGFPFEATCRTILEMLPALPDHRLKLLAGGALELSWTPSSGNQLSVARMPGLL